MHDSLVLETERLALTAMTAPALRAWLEKDAEALRTLTGAWFPEPVESPPLFGKDLPMFLDRMEETPAELGWWVWLVQRKDSHLAVGVCGLSGRPLDGGTMLGYSVYPEHEGHGYATEASKALVAWVLQQPGAYRVDATVPIAHSASISVAVKLGMSEVGRDSDPKVGEIAAYRLERST
ncbi:MAG: GNAT family N-acetyltransferase [Gemmatimonadales bacterium]|nr:GNAT family N-acetyltransferase [Gemmatimonadales bacterium]MBT5046258.1 GNAT family N-acetyltransferase [Gemmatimonadales bacterium]MBT7694471.1 GNAT family N-acetyltransferase [Gemmatimonadales bacterium]